jgi:hypothetical protein
MLVQARGVALPLWLGHLGYDVVEPEEAQALHSRLPIAYYDCALLEKQLPPPPQPRPPQPPPSTQPRPLRQPPSQP